MCRAPPHQRQPACHGLVHQHCPPPLLFTAAPPRTSPQQPPQPAPAVRILALLQGVLVPPQEAQADQGRCVALLHGRGLRYQQHTSTSRSMRVAWSGVSSNALQGTSITSPDWPCRSNPTNHSCQQTNQHTDSSWRYWQADIRLRMASTYRQHQKYGRFVIVDTFTAERYSPQL